VHYRNFKDLNEYHIHRVREQQKSLSLTMSQTQTNPIKVNRVSEEYQYIRENCKGCRVISQALINKGKSYYDELKVQKPDGTIVSYFFDITSFYLDF